MKRRTIRITLMSMGLVLCWGCAGVDVSRDVDADYDFSQLRSWNFLDVAPAPADVDSLTLGRVQDAIEQELTSKGFERSAAPDFGIAVRAVKDTRTDVEGHDYDWSVRDSTNLQAFQYDEGTLTIDIVDIASQRMVWQSTGTAIIGSVDAKSATNRIHAAVEKMLSSFPPR
jgi:hypothetical protein